jgi:aspartyl-tRNA(Asn)/glutamyl-tRNA(Gln) amidotransferase subunit A
VVAAGTPITRSEAFALHRRRVESHAELFGEDVLRRLELGRELRAWELVEAWERVRAWRREVELAFERFDLLASPTTAIVAPPAESAEMIETTRQLTRLTLPWSLAGNPALSVPCGFSEGLPVGLQLAAARWGERTLFEAGETYQARTDWHLRRPPE